MSEPFTLRMGDASKAVHIGRFEDTVNLRHAKRPVHMWEELEPMIEEDEDNDEDKKQTDFRRRRRRYTFRRKSGLPHISIMSS